MVPRRRPAKEKTRPTSIKNSADRTVPPADELQRNVDVDDALRQLQRLEYSRRHTLTRSGTSSTQATEARRVSASVRSQTSGFRCHIQHSLQLVATVDQGGTSRMLAADSAVTSALFIGVGAQSTLGGHDIFARKIRMKN